MDYRTISPEEYIPLLEERDRRIQYLEFELAQIKRAIFGSKSERFKPAASPEQLQMFGSEHNAVAQGKEQDGAADTKKTVKKKKKPVRQKLPAHLKREETIIEPQGNIAEMRCIGQQVSEKLEMTPIQFYVRTIVRPKYVDAQGQIHIADLPGDPFPKCIAGASVAAHVAVSKYMDHLPLYRQNQIYARQDIDLARSTLNGIIRRGSELIRSIYERLNQKALASDYLQADESSLKVLTKDHPDGYIKGCMLIKVAPEEKIAVMEYIRTKEKINLHHSLKGFKGYLQVDGK